MLSSSIPPKFDVPWASSAGVGYITSPIPLGPSAPGRASLQQGFPPTTFEPEASGGNPPFGADANGILNQATEWLQWMEAGGWVGYDAAFSAAILGYPNGAILNSAMAGHFWISSMDNNVSDPDTAGAGWIPFPDLLIQQQGGNWTPTDSGAVNAAKVTLSPLPVSWAAMNGAPIRFLIADTNTTTAVTLELIGVSGSLGTKVLKNTDGSAMAIGQLTAGGLVEGFYDGTVVQVACPAKPPASVAVTNLQPGMILLCPNETPFVGTLECDGSSLLRSAYPNLFNSIGTRYGAADGSHFNIPDMRGIFPRGWDHGRGLDPSAGTRAAPGVLAPTRSGATGPAGDHVGTTEAMAVGPFTAANIEIDDPAFYLNPGLQGGGYLWYTPMPFSDGGYVLGAPLDESKLKFWGLSPPFDSIGTFLIPAGNGGADLPNFAPQWLIQTLAGSGSITTNSPETRPVNIDMMYVIVY